MPQLQDNLTKIKAIIEEHNQYSNNIAEEIKKAKKTLKWAIIADHFEEYEKKEETDKNAQEEFTTIKDDIKSLEDDIKTLESEISNSLEPTDELNKELKEYFGHDEIKVEINGNGIGYKITRGKNRATALSEGGKTGIAILYFLKSLKDKSFNLQEGIVVMNDPICSLDEGALFRAFGYIKARTKDAKQLFILTHHFSFFREVRKWFARNYKKKPKENTETKLEKCKKNDCPQKKEAVHSFYQVVCKNEGNERKSNLKELDPLLKDYNSEYHYLFSLVKKYSKEDKNLADYYPMPNVGRRLLEAFLAFKIPNNDKNDGNYAKIEQLTNNQEVKEILINFLNKYSHNKGIPQGGHDSTSLQEMPEVMKNLLKFIETTDKQHFDILNGLTK